MALTSELTGLGMPPAQAGKVGHNVSTLAGATTAQATATLIQNSVTLATTSSGQTAFVLPSSASLLKEFYVYNQSATTALVFPPSGGNFNGGTTDASVSVAQGKTTMFLRVSAANWITLAGA